MSAEVAATKPARGRKRDLTKDPEILKCALDVLAESGYDGMTIDIVAARANAARATVYRRWPTKSELVVDAIGSAGSAATTLVLPDTGTLAGDFRALLSVDGRAANAQRMKIIVGVLPALPSNPELAAAVNRQMIAPQTAVMRSLLERAQARGEIAAGLNLDMLALIVPSMAAYRAVIANQPMDADYVSGIIDDVLLPAVGLAGT